MENQLDRYLREHSTPPEEALDWIYAATYMHTNHPHMISGPVQGRLLRMIASLSGAKRVLEIGAFTGYSTACIALALPEDGMVDTLEQNDELEDLMRKGWEKAGVSKRIRLHLGDAIRTLKTLSGPYDMVFMDADKRQYADYYSLALPLLRPGGLMIADDVLWNGKVYAPGADADPKTRGLTEFNDMVAKAPRVETVMIPLRDGLSLIRKK